MMNRYVHFVMLLVILTSCGRSEGAEPLAGKFLHGEFRADSGSVYDPAVCEDTVLLPEAFECIGFVFGSPKEQADSLVAFMNRARNSPPAVRRIWEQRFFCAFPGSFKGMQCLFGYDDVKGPAPLYHAGEKMIQYFSTLRSIPDSLYYFKYISINLNGVWEADNVREAFGLQQRLLEDTDNVCRSLADFSDREIISVFRFIFDGPHPRHKHNAALYSQLRLRLDAQGGCFSKLLSQAYEEILAEDDGHGK